MSAVIRGPWAMNSTSRSVLLTRLDSAGDVLLAGPAVRAVAASGARVTLLCSSRGAPAARMLPGVDEVLIFDAPWVLHGNPPAVRISQLSALIWKLRRKHFDDSLILTSSFQSSLPMALILRLAGVGRICAISDDYPGSLLDVRADADPEEHEVVRGLAVAQAAGYEPDGQHLAVRPELPTVDWPGKRTPYVVIHPGAAVPARQWPMERARATVRELDRMGYQVVVTGSRDEQDLARYVASGYGVDLSGRTNLPELAAVLRDAEAVVVGNTGPAHLAAAVGAPIVSLFSPVVPASKWAPCTDRVMVLGDQHAPCADSRARACPIPGHPCLSSVSQHDVLDAIAALTKVRT